VIGSCAYTTEAAFDRPGQPYGGDYEIFASIDKEKPDFMVWMGDNWYYREPDWLTESAMRYRASYDRAQSYYQPLWRSFPHYATWDDHDFGPNDSDRTFRMREEALEVFSDYFPTASSRGWGATKGSFFRFEWGDVEFFMLDDRFHRTPNRWPNRQEAHMLGPEQLQWLKESLASSNAAFKVIVNGGQMIQPMVFFEAFGQFPAEQKSLFDFIAQNDVRGVVFLSGDRHATELLRVQYPGAAYPWTEFTSSPLSSGAGQNDREANNPARVPGTWVTRKRNFGVIEVTGPRENRVMTMLAKDKDGTTLWTHSVNARDLRRPN
jgi:alkaline phosphatase D